MNKTSVARIAAIHLATLAIVSALTGVFAAPALADPEPPAPTSSAQASPEPPSGPTAPEPSSTPPQTSKPAEQDPPAAPAVQKKVETTFVFDKPSYRTDEDVRFVFRVKNISAGRLAGLKINYFPHEPGSLKIMGTSEADGWGPFGHSPGVTLEPGAAYEVKVTGQLTDIENDTAILRGFLSLDSGRGAGPSVGYFDTSVRVTRVAGHAAGLLFGDKNGNGAPDEGERLADTAITLQYANGPAKYTATSDADGRVDFGDVPAAKYHLGGEMIKGWLFPWEVVQIRPDKKDLLLRGAPPLNGALKASVAFNRHDYTKGELARLTVTLSNSGPIPLIGVVAECNRIGDPFSLGGGAGWGPIGYHANGVTIAPGQTRTFAVSSPVPDAAFDRGILKVDCDFGYRGVDIENHAQASDKAPVSGAKATVAGHLYHVPGEDKPYQGLAGVRVVLVSDGACPVVGEQTTDANGDFEFHDVVPGPKHWLYLLPPPGWRTTGDNPESIIVRASAGKPDRRWIQAEPGEAPPPAVPTQVPNCGVTPTPPAPTSGAPGSGSGQSGNAALASTGADVLGLGAFTLVALALGVALILASRRRRQPD
ncbi:hypothetical protein [Amycolatopsis sp. lyj-112]|uniref:hypothetical protein n=1 Tax=Amycolatopsis sp. lyj-112 TaxID=2789288 RepID=UPI00397B2D5A